MPYPDSTYEQQWREARDNAPFILVPVHSGHTPGPWLRESEINDEGCDWILVTKDYAEIVDLRLKDGLVVSEQEQDANAFLIAAAPDLLAAAKLVLEAGDQEYVKFIVRDAISKAEGRG